MKFSLRWWLLLVHAQAILVALMKGPAWCGRLDLEQLVYVALWFFVALCGATSD